MVINRWKLSQWLCKEFGIAMNSLVFFCFVECSFFCLKAIKGSNVLKLYIKKMIELCIFNSTISYSLVGSLLLLLKLFLGRIYVVLETFARYRVKEKSAWVAIEDHKLKFDSKDGRPARSLHPLLFLSFTPNELFIFTK